MFLFIWGFGPSALVLTDGSLGVDIINAQKTVIPGSIQCGNLQTVSTRTEVTRWFGVALLYALNGANVLTSGTDNDWGFRQRSVTRCTLLLRQNACLQITCRFKSVLSCSCYLGQHSSPSLLTVLTESSPSAFPDYSLLEGSMMSFPRRILTGSCNYIVSLFKQPLDRH